MQAAACNLTCWLKQLIGPLSLDGWNMRGVVPDRSAVLFQKVWRQTRDESL